ncbi:MAG: hypothetical protein U9R25_12680 [Chloroflexota bacterium]|nr:hypothetical protein [Chloroflexota bacterium]
MTAKKKAEGTTSGADKQGADVRIEGRVQLESMDAIPSDVKLMAYAFDKRGKLIGQAPVDPEGTFSVLLRIKSRAPVEMYIAPEADPQAIRKSPAYRQQFSTKDWLELEEGLRLKPVVFLPRHLWWPWWPKWICVHGKIEKQYEDDGVTETCPVPFVKVEIFDVDREACWWPYILRWWPHLLDYRVIDLPRLLKEPPELRERFPIPDPVPDPFVPFAEPAPAARERLAPGEAIGINPQPEPPIELRKLVAAAKLSPQPEPPDLPVAATRFAAGPTLAGEIANLDPQVASRLAGLTLTSKIAPWHFWPWCFFSKQLICETTTDENGNYRCCFNWWPLEIRRGRLRWDGRPDIIIRVTQVVDGVERVIYMDPYTSTRWNVTDAEINLTLDDPEIVCGPGHPQARPPGTQVFFTRIGNDEVYWIDQASGLYGKAPWSNVAYGNYSPEAYWLRFFGQFGDTLSSEAAMAGATPPYFYKLSYSQDGTNFTPITANLTDTRVAKTTLFSETFNLGPHPVGSEPALYRVRNFADYFWYNPDWLGAWNTRPVEPDTDTYIVRLEIFDSTGTKLDSSLIDYRDGTQPPPAVLPTMTDQCDLKVTVDNKRPEISMTISPNPGVCGVIPWGLVPPLNIDVEASHENNRLRAWHLRYGKGTTAGSTHLDGDSSYGGSLAPVSKTVNANAMLAGLTSTCAFWVRLWAAPHIRDGYRWIHGASDTDAVVIEKCPPCPPCP